MKLFFKILTILIFAQLITAPVFAACYEGGKQGGVLRADKETLKECCDAGFEWEPGGCPSSSSSGSKVRLDNPLGRGITMQQLIGRVINGLLGIVGSIALIMFIYGGFMWMTAAGAADKVEKGKQTLMWATIGLIVIFASYALVKFVIDAIGAK